MKLHLIDGTFELFRSFYGRKDTRLAPDGTDINAVHGVLTSTLDLLNRPGVTHVAAAFDTVIESFRNDMFDGYKTGEGVDPALLAQFPLVEEALAAAGVTVWGMTYYEADDAIATAAFRWMDDVEQVVLCSPDKDLMQCVVGDTVVCWDRMRDRWFNEAGVVEKFGVAPESIPDYLALVGDTADGVPGLPGWGAKSTAAVLARWGRLEMIPDDPAAWDVSIRSAAKLAAALAENRPMATLYRTLTTLRRDVPLKESLEDLEWKGYNEAAFAEISERLGF
ncbi:MAG TPA: 5'-3' exonuclease H3TH domain-containing protein [Acidimicrobiia bacterium]|nr:5'-3' exonuclease H3TH domain-containing protein [Acidimicrobiia bacterium]